MNSQQAYNNRNHMLHNYDEETNDDELFFAQHSNLLEQVNFDHQQEQQQQQPQRHQYTHNGDLETYYEHKRGEADTNSRLLTRVELNCLGQVQPNVREMQSNQFMMNAQQQAANPSQSVNYRKVRPESINDRRIVSSVVGFLHDVVSGTNASTNNSNSANANSTSNGINANQASDSSYKTGFLQPLVNSNSNSSLSNAAHEIKEQIEWLHFENPHLLRKNNAFLANKSSSVFASSNLILVLGYKTGFAVWSIDLNGVATEALNVKEPNITRVKLLKMESKILVAICKMTLNSSVVVNDLINLSNSSNSSDNFSHPILIAPQASLTNDLNNVLNQHQYKIGIVDVLSGNLLHELIFNEEIFDFKSNADILCVNSWNRIDAFDLNSFQHRFTINTCYSHVSKSTGKLLNAFTLSDRWLAFADNKFHGMLASIGGVSADVEQSYTATVLNTAKSISKGLVTVVNSVVNKSKSTSASNSSSNSNNHSPRLAGVGSNSKSRHDSKDDHQAGICTIVDTKKFTNSNNRTGTLHDENQNWIVAHFQAHHESIYALEFNHNGRLLVTADALGQYFNVFQININPFKCTRTVVKHLYALYRGDTNAKVRNINFSPDSRWLAVSTKRGTTHIFPLNAYGGPVNARTHSKPYVVNRTSKHQRTAGFVDQDEFLPPDSSHPLHHLQQQHQQYEVSHSAPIVINNNPKLKSLIEPFVISTYGQLKQPNVNSTFQSSVISSNAYSGLLMTAHQTNQLAAVSNMPTISGSNLAASALTSAAMVTENVTNFASNTTNLIQYDNVCPIAFFAESRGYLSPEEPRDFNKLKPVNSLFVISDVNGNLVEFVLDVVVDISKTGNKVTNDSPIQLKITPKAQWPLQRLITSEEVNYPIQPDNPLLTNGLQRANSLRKGSINAQNSLINNNSKYTNIESTSFPNSYSPNSFYQTAPNSLTSNSNTNNNDWIKMIDVNTHIGPHRRLFMGPQFVFKTFNSNLTTTKLNACSSSIIGDNETPIIDLSSDIELNTLDITNAGSRTAPKQIKRFDCTPTYIEVGAGSFQEGMPIIGSSGSQSSQRSLNNQDLLGETLIESLADAMNETSISSTSHSPIPTTSSGVRHYNANLNGSNQSTNKLSDFLKKSQAISISNKMMNDQILTAPSSSGSNSSDLLTVGSYFLINPNSNLVQPIVNTSITSCTSSSSASSSGSNMSSNHEDDCMTSSGSNQRSINPNSMLFKTKSIKSQKEHTNSLEHIQFQDDNLLH